MVHPDFEVKTNLDPTYRNGELKLVVKVENAGMPVLRN